MLTLFGRRSQRSCDNISRRDFLRVGALGLGGLTLADVLRSDAQGKTAGRPRSVIYVVLSGGPSHIDMYDLKPDAPEEYRGAFKPIQTRLPGVQICEHMPRQAAMMDQLTLLRGIRSVENDHFLSEVYTGLPRTAGRRPGFGCIASRLLRRESALPPYVSLHREPIGGTDYERPLYAGPGHAPFRPFGSALDDLKPVESLDKLQDRRRLLGTFDAIRRDLDNADSLNAMDKFQAQAMDIVTSARVREAFDLSKEPDRLVASYGKDGKFTHQTVKTIVYPFDSKPFVLARRLVEAGVRVATVQVSAWDHHGGTTTDIFLSLRLMLPALDRAVAALCDDLRVRGLDKDVLVVVLGEFGRTPKIELPGPGRGHWADAGCAIFYGGGLRMGQVIGETDSRGERAKSGSVGFQNIMATLYHVLGIDPSSSLPDFSGRPICLLDDQKPIEALI
jgi:hypothetical protein